MKVGTDGVLLGAWTNIGNSKKALDIGTGSGLIALMLAQRNPELTVKAIDVDRAAIGQATENAAHSPFRERICCELTSLQDYVLKCKERYDLIVSNPPFFNNSLKSPDSTRTVARHTDSLDMHELIALSAKLLNDEGRLSIIYPHEYKEKLTEIAQENGLLVSRKTNVYPTPSSTPRRVLMEFSKSQSEIQEDNLIIETDRHTYSNDFKQIVKDFYLKL